MTDRPILLRYEGEGEFKPASPHWARECDKRFVIGETYTLVEQHERSSKTHAHEFAWLKDAWLNLDDSLYTQFPTPEHLRKFALIRKGFCTMQQHVCKSKAEALRLAAAIRPYDEYQIVTVQNEVVNVFHAKSQSKRAMNRQEFQESKTAVLDYVAGLLSVSPKQLEGRAA